VSALSALGPIWQTLSAKFKDFRLPRALAPARRVEAEAIRGDQRGPHPATAAARTCSNTATISRTCAGLNRSSGPLGARSMNGDS
jgi:hypothetical protein